MKYDLRQHNILVKLRLYAKKCHLDKSVFKQLDSGYCVAFTAMYLYAAWLESVPVRFDAKGQLIPRDDLHWLVNTLYFISKWDGKRKLASEDKKQFERVISLLNYYQSNELTASVINEALFES